MSTKEDAGGDLGWNGKGVLGGGGGGERNRNRKNGNGKGVAGRFGMDFTIDCE
jgi:hypothetical protein